MGEGAARDDKGEKSRRQIATRHRGRRISCKRRRRRSTRKLSWYLRQKEDEINRRGQKCVGRKEGQEEWKRWDGWQKESKCEAKKGRKERSGGGDEWQGVGGDFDWHWGSRLHQQPRLQVTEATAESTDAPHSGRSWWWPPPWKSRRFITEAINQHAWPPLHTAHAPDCLLYRLSYPLCGNCRMLQQQIHWWYTGQHRPGSGDGPLFVANTPKRQTLWHSQLWAGCDVLTDFQDCLIKLLKVKKDTIGRKWHRNWHNKKNAQFLT